MSGFFFFFVSFSRVFFSLREKIVVPLLLLFLLLFFLLLSCFLSFLGVRKEEKKYISRKKRAFSFREREEYSHHHLRSRGTEGKETLAVITSSFSLFVVVVVRFAAGNKVCH